ncbi:signal recognition particle-docking protein FtsY [bacterium]|nr:signal recognition particle-docking protein FtsY [bacterium]
MGLFSNLKKLKDGLTKTRESIATKISEVITRKVKIDEETIDDLEEILISSDLGSELTEQLINNTKSSLLKEQNRSVEIIKEFLKKELLKIIVPNTPSVSSHRDIPKDKFHVILIIGINGSGKSTTIGKLAHKYKSEGKKVIIGSADTFRAAANDQLKSWATKAGVDLIEGISKDPSAVVYETVQSALSKDYDIVLIDTAGRLHNNKNLMLELNKITGVISNLLSGAPHECLLVVDGNSGQNAIKQFEEFNKFANLSGVIITKLDGTAKGGSVLQISSTNKIPIRYIGVGEGIEDLQEFDPEEFVNALFM